MALIRSRVACMSPGLKGSELAARVQERTAKSLQESNAVHLHC